MSLLPVEKRYNHIYKRLTYLWPLSILFLIYGYTKLLQWYYQSTDPFLAWKVYKHNFNKVVVDPTSVPVFIYIGFLIFLALVGVIAKVNPFLKLYRKTRHHGSARPANFSDIVEMGYYQKSKRPFAEQKKGVYLCRYQGKDLFLSEPLSVLILAPPGTGKSSAVAIPTLFYCPWSMLVLDVKKELYDTTSNHRAKFSNICIFEPSSHITSCWNPLAKDALPQDWSDIYVTVQRVASNIFVEKPGSGDPHWVSAARAIFLNVALAMIKKKGGTSIPDVYDATLPKGSKSQQETIAAYAKIPGLPPQIKGDLKTYETMAPNQFSGEIGTFKSQMLAFLDDKVRYALSKNEIQFKDLRGKNGKPTTIYLIIRADDVDRLAPLIRLFFESFTKYILSRPWDKKSEYKITALLDEFPRLGEVKEVIQSPALSRGVGVNSILIGQSAGQIERIYKKAGLEEIMSSTAVKIIFPQNDHATAKLISESIGQQTVKTESTSSNHSNLYIKNHSHSERGFALFTPQDVMSMKMGATIILSQFFGETPIVGKSGFWFKNKRLLKIQGPYIFPEPSETDPPLDLPSDDVIAEFYNFENVSNPQANSPNAQDIDSYIPPDDPAEDEEPDAFDEENPEPPSEKTLISVAELLNQSVAESEPVNLDGPVNQVNSGSIPMDDPVSHEYSESADPPATRGASPGAAGSSDPEAPPKKSKSRIKSDKTTEVPDIDEADQALLLDNLLSELEAANDQFDDTSHFKDDY